MANKKLILTPEEQKTLKTLLEESGYARWTSVAMLIAKIENAEDTDEEV